MTLGHLGPDAVRTILALGKPRALFVIGIIGQHYIEADFTSTLEDLRASGTIQSWQVI